MYDRILVPVNGSDQANKGLAHAVSLASALDATIHALYVIDLPGAPRTPYIRDDEDAIRREYHAYGRNVTGQACDQAANAGVECVTACKSGAVHEEVAAYARTEAIDVIVVGTPYRGKFGALLGGTAEKIVRTASVPVTTVRQGEDE